MTATVVTPNVINAQRVDSLSEASLQHPGTSALAEHLSSQYLEEEDAGVSGGRAAGRAVVGRAGRSSLRQSSLRRLLQSPVSGVTDCSSPASGVLSSGVAEEREDSETTLKRPRQQQLLPQVSFEAYEAHFGPVAR
jgi:hypothetical protein